jgi:glucose-1-phosphate thymidylyltransferase
MKGVILAAGKGTRLYPATRHIPKPLLPLANRPTIHYALERLLEIGVEDICVVVGENEPAMRDALGDGSSYGARLSLARQSEPKGLAHAMASAREFVGSDDFIMYLGDAIYTKPLTDLYDEFQSSSCANLNLVLEVEDPRRFGVANVADGKIVRLVEKPANPESNLAMAGVYFFRPQIWEVLPDLKPSARGEYEITDAIQLLVERGEIVLPGMYRGMWFDTGTLPSFLECTAQLLGGGVLVGGGTVVNSPLGPSTCIGDGAMLECASISNSTILPGANVRVSGRIKNCLIGGGVESAGDIESAVTYDDEIQTY